MDARDLDAVMRVDAEVKQLRDDLTQTRLDLLSSDAIREALVNQSVDTARDLARALEMVETAFRVGFKRGRENGMTGRGIDNPDVALRTWIKEIEKT